MKAHSLTNYFGTGVLAVCATFGQAWMVSVARADEAPRTQSVRIGDLDLSRSADVARLYRRINHAAQIACGGEITTGSRLPSTAQRQCIEQAVDGAVAQINNATLWAYHRQEASGAKEAAKPGA